TLAGSLWLGLTTAGWMVLGGLTPMLAGQLGLSGLSKGLLVGVPILAVLLFPGVIDLLVDRFGARKPERRRWIDLLADVRERGVLRFCLFQAVAVGGSLGLGCFVGMWFQDQYSLAPVYAGCFATLCVGAACLLQPVGESLAERIGAVSLLTIAF